MGGHGHEPAMVDILFNVGVQIINLAVFFFLFKKFFAEKIFAAVEERKKLAQKLKNAEQEYEDIISKARSEADQIVEKSKEYKKSIIHEAHMAAEKEKEKIIDEANRKAQSLTESAQQEISNKKKQLEEEWEKSVKYMTKQVVKKIFEEDVNLKEEYMDKVVGELKK